MATRRYRRRQSYIDFVTNASTTTAVPGRVLAVASVFDDSLVRADRLVVSAPLGNPPLSQDQVNSIVGSLGTFGATPDNALDLEKAEGASAIGINIPEGVDPMELRDGFLERYPDF